MTQFQPELKMAKRLLCQCGPRCTKPPIKGTAFCKNHSRCTRKSPMSGYEPKYDPDFFNKLGAVDLRESHNCYAYAVGHVNMSAKKDTPFIQPGYAAGYPFFGNKQTTPNLPEHTCADIVSRLKGDMPSIVGPVGFADKCPPKTSKIALVVDPSADYHYYRQDSNGWWSHKPGGTSVTNLDAVGAKIWDPSLASRIYDNKTNPLKYTSMCGFFCTPRDRVPRVKGGRKTLRRRKMTRRKTLKK